MLKWEEMRGKYHSLISEAFKAASILQIERKFPEEWKGTRIILLFKGEEEEIARIGDLLPLLVFVPD
jgi:hypothetical protein